MGMDTTTTLLTPELKQTYDKKLLSVAEVQTVFQKYGTKKGIPARGGKSIEFRRFERFSLPTGSFILTEGTAPAETNATVNYVAATISQYGQYSRVTDVLNFQSFDPLIAEYTEKYGLAMGEGLDIICREEFTNASTVQYADDKTAVATGGGSSTVGSGNYLDAAELNEMKRTLARNGARPINGRFICFIHQDNTKDLYEDPDIVDAIQLAAPRSDNNPMFTGVLGDWMGIRFVETNNLRVRSSYGLSGADIYEVIMVADEAYGVIDLSSMGARVIVQKPGGVTDPLEQYSTIGWKAAFACKILNNNFMGKILCASSRTPSAG